MGRCFETRVDWFHLTKACESRNFFARFSAPFSSSPQFLALTFHLPHSISRVLYSVFVVFTQASVSHIVSRSSVIYICSPIHSSALWKMADFVTLLENSPIVSSASSSGAIDDDLEDACSICLEPFSSEDPSTVCSDYVYSHVFMYVQARTFHKICAIWCLLEWKYEIRII